MFKRMNGPGGKTDNEKKLALAALAAFGLAACDNNNDSLTHPGRTGVSYANYEDCLRSANLAGVDNPLTECNSVAPNPLPESVLTAAEGRQPEADRQQSPDTATRDTVQEPEYSRLEGVAGGTSKIGINFDSVTQRLNAGDRADLFFVVYGGPNTQGALSIPELSSPAGEASDIPLSTIPQATLRAPGFPNFSGIIRRDRVERADLFGTMPEADRLAMDFRSAYLLPNITNYPSESTSNSVIHIEAPTLTLRDGAIGLIVRITRADGRVEYSEQSMTTPGTLESPTAGEDVRILFAPANVQ